MSCSILSRDLRPIIIGFCLIAVALFVASCAKSGPNVDAKESKTAKTRNEIAPVALTTTKAVARQVPSYIQATGSLVADETSDVAPEVSGQVIATPVSVGTFVRQGAVVARLNNRDALLRLRQASAGVRQALAGVRQAEARLGLLAGGNFDASTIPEVRAASANYDQAVAQLRLAEANESRYRDLVTTGDVAQSVYDQLPKRGSLPPLRRAVRPSCNMRANKGNFAPARRRCCFYRKASRFVSALYRSAIDVSPL